MSHGINLIHGGNLVMINGMRVSFTMCVKKMTLPELERGVTRRISEEIQLDVSLKIVIGIFRRLERAHQLNLSNMPEILT